MGRRGRPAGQAPTEAVIRLWWRSRGDEITEDLRKVAYLQGQLHNTIESLQSALGELRSIIESPDEEEGDDA